MRPRLCRTGLRVCCAALLLNIQVRSDAAVVLAASCSQADVQAAINAVRTGDIVRVPAGTVTWTGELALRKGIHLRGAGGGGFVGHSRTSQAIGAGAKTFTTQSALALEAGQTVRAIYIGNGTRFMEGTVTSCRGTTLELNVGAAGGSGTLGAWVFALPARTTIINNAANDWGRAMVDVSESPDASIEISGIRFQSGTATYGAHVNLKRTAGGKPVVIHDCWFTHGGDIGRSIQVMNSRGIVYRCSFDGGLDAGVPVLHHTGITLKWLGGEASESWTTPDTMGAKDTTGLNNFYVEDCYFAGAQCFDFDDNSRAVVRHCQFDNSNLGSHGAETSPDGLRHFGLYGNAFLFDNLGDDTLNLCRWFWLRGGTGIITDNVMPDLKSQIWGDGDEIQIIVMSLRRKCRYAGHAYPVPHQVGQIFFAGNNRLLNRTYNSPNLEQIRKVEEMIAYANSKRITVWIHPWWSRQRLNERVSEEQMRRWWRYVIARLGTPTEEDTSGGLTCRSRPQARAHGRSTGLSKRTRSIKDYPGSLQYKDWLLHIRRAEA
jgi:hypothetical protein